MAKNYITINGKIEKEPKINADKSVSLVFKIDKEKDMTELEKVKTSYCVVHVTSEKWNQVKKHADKELMIGGFVGANVNSKGTPFLEVSAAYIVPDKNNQEQRVNPNWASEGPIKQIKLKDIVLASDAHFETMRLSIDGVVLKKVNASKKINTPICVRPIGNGKYDLSIGLSRFVTAKILGLDTISCVVSKLDRLELGEKYGLDKLGKYNKKPHNNSNKAKTNNKRPVKPNNKQQNKPKQQTRSVQY